MKKLIMKFQYILCVGSRILNCMFFISNLVSIHLMCRFKVNALPFRAYNMIVSIHLMCRFKTSNIRGGRSSGKVSIHLMCRFKFRNESNSYLRSTVSIHLMCRFKRVSFVSVGTVRVFQYILCVGSSMYFSINDHSVYAFQYILCVGSSLSK